MSADAPLKTTAERLGYAELELTPSTGGGAIQIGLEQAKRDFSSEPTGPADRCYSSQRAPVAGTVPVASGVAAWAGVDLSLEPIEPAVRCYSLQRAPVAGTVPAALGVAV